MAHLHHEPTTLNPNPGPELRIVTVIEEDDDLRELMTGYLEIRGCHVLALSEPPELCDLERLQPDVVILDLIYGGQPIGLTTVVDLDCKLETTVVVLTGDAELVEAQQAILSRHVATVLLKPFELDDFDRAVGIVN